MDADQGLQAQGMPESRTGAFGNGQSEGKLAIDSAKFNAQVPKGFTQHSVLQNPYPTMNGMAATDFQRILPGMRAPMMSGNGSSDGSYQQSLLMRLRGQVIG